MNIIDLIKNRRSIRLFKQEKIDRSILIELVETARTAPSGANIQSLKYIIVDTPAACENVFTNLSWAGHVKPNRTPAPEQRPVAYIVVIFDSEIKSNASVDAAAAIENVLIAAYGLKIGSCWLGSIDRKALSDKLCIPDKYKVDSVIALGKPAEKPVLEDSKGNNTKYYLDNANVLHVPKRPLKKITYLNKFAEPI